MLVCGWLLGGTVGLGTVVYALGIGPLAQLFLPLLHDRTDATRELHRRQPVQVHRRGTPHAN